MKTIQAILEFALRLANFLFTFKKKKKDEKHPFPPPPPCPDTAPGTDAVPDSAEPYCRDVGAQRDSACLYSSPTHTVGLQPPALAQSAQLSSLIGWLLLAATTAGYIYKAL